MPLLGSVSGIAGPDVRAQLVKRNVGKRRHATCAIHRDAVPLRDRSSLDPKLFGEPGEKATLILRHASEQGHTLAVHASPLSTTKRLLSRTYLASALGRLSANGTISTAVEISAVIRQARDRARLSQRGLAAKLKVSPSAVAQWETAVTLPSVVKRVELAKLLHIPFTDLVPEGEFSASDALTDPVIAAIVQQLVKFPEPVRQSVLIQVTALGQILLGDEQAPPTD